MSHDKCGIYRGVCTDNNDPEQRSRIRVMVASLFGTQPTEWAFPCLPPGWRQNLLKPTKPAHSFVEYDPALPGLVYVPDHALERPVPGIGEPVWVMFEAGDADKPVYMGVY